MALRILLCSQQPDLPLDLTGLSDDPLENVNNSYVQGLKAGRLVGLDELGARLANPSSGVAPLGFIINDADGYEYYNRATLASKRVSFVPLTGGNIIETDQLVAGETFHQGDEVYAAAGSDAGLLTINPTPSDAEVDQDEVNWQIPAGVISTGTGATIRIRRTSGSRDVRFGVSAARRGAGEDTPVDIGSGATSAGVTTYTASVKSTATVAQLAAAISALSDVEADVAVGSGAATFNGTGAVTASSSLVSQRVPAFSSRVGIVEADPGPITGTLRASGMVRVHC